MLIQFRQTARRAHDTLIADAMGALALMVILVGALHLPELF